MSQYVKEYEEAISRLNAPERSPLPYAPIPYGPVPNHCNYMNWNRIMAETRQGVLPKYSILQRIDLSSQNDLVMVSDAKEYTYTLDPSFTFAKGARKSIAIRAVDIYNVIPNGQTKLSREFMSGKVEITALVQGATKKGTLSLNNITYEASNDFAVSMNNFAQAFIDMLITNIDNVMGLDITDTEYTATYIPAGKKIYAEITFVGHTDRVVSLSSVTITTQPKWVIKNSTILDYYNTVANPADVNIEMKKYSNQIYASFILPGDILDFRQASICGSINPWTKNNLIAPLTYTSDTLTKVFPWNGCTEARFWFINDKGEKVRWRVVRGYIDLELIIDNSDTYALDND